MLIAPVKDIEKNIDQAVSTLISAVVKPETARWLSNSYLTATLIFPDIPI